MMHDQNGGQDDPFGEYRKRREQWRAEREARRNAWKASRDARRAMWSHGWGHFGDPKFWGLDAESLKKMGMGAGMGMGGAQSSEVEALKAQVADMQKIISSLSERVIVLEKLATNDDARLAAEIEKLRDSDT